MKTSDRYIKLIQAKLRMQQAKIELEDAKSDFENSILLSEANGGEYGFDGEAVTLAINTLSGYGVVDVKSATYVGSKLTYNRVEINLHCSKSSLGSKAMYNIINAD